MEFGVVARYLPHRKAGFIQTSGEEIIFFRARDAHYLMLDEHENRIVFTNPRARVPSEGDLVVFERSKFYGSIPDIEFKTRAWGTYTTWLFFHGVQMLNFKRLQERA